MHSARIDEPILSLILMMVGTYLSLFFVNTMVRADWVLALTFFVLGVCLSITGLYKLLCAWVGTTEMRRSGAMAAFLIWTALNAISIVAQGWSLLSATFMGLLCAEAGVYIGARTERQVPGLLLALWGVTLTVEASSLPALMSQIAQPATWGFCLVAAALADFGVRCSPRATRYSTGGLLLIWLFIALAHLFDYPHYLTVYGIWLLLSIVGATMLALVVHVASLSWLQNAFQ